MRSSARFDVSLLLATALAVGIGGGACLTHAPAPADKRTLPYGLFRLKLP